jgi:small conductance mechanosensitive channel
MWVIDASRKDSLKPEVLKLMLNKWSQGLRVRAIVLTGVVCVFAVWTTPVRSQGEPSNGEAEVKEEVKDVKTEVKNVLIQALQAEKPADPKAATTTKDVKIPVDELKVLVKPLTLDELQNETAAWMLVVQKKAQEISEAEVTIKRQNQAISKQQEGADALEKAKKALEEAENAQKGAAPGSPKYKEATKKVEEAQENLKKAQEAVEKAKTTKAELKQDETSRKALEKATKTGDLETAKQTIEKTKAARDKTTAGSLAYEQATKTIEKLEAAIKAVEKAQEAQKSAKPDSPEYKEATQKVEKAQEALKQVLQEIGGANTTKSSSEQSSKTLNQATAALENTEIKTNEEQKVAGSPGVVNNQQNLQQKQQQLEKTTEQLQKSADKESEAKNQLVVTVTQLQAELTAIVDRFNVILDELEKKGGDAKSYRQYIKAATTVEVDAKDTEGLGLRLLSWAKSDQGGLRWAGNIGKFVGIMIASIIVAQILGAILNRLLSVFGGTSKMLRQFIVMVVTRGGVVVGFLLALTALEVSLGPVLALIGGVSFILAFALQSNLGNLASGLMIMTYKPFDVGDEIKIGDIWGWVNAITLANTVIEGASGEIYNIPNNMVWDSTIENLTPDEIRQVEISLRIGFDEDLPQVEELLVEIFQSHPVILENPSPKSRVDSIEEYYILVSVRGWMKAEPPLNRILEIRSEIMRMIRERFNKEGIKLAAIPTSMEVGLEDFGNGKIPHLDSETSVQQMERLVSEIPTERVAQ